MVDRLNVAIVGGTFDPPHELHIQQISIASSIAWIDETIVVPAIQNPDKSWQPMFCISERIRMLEESILWYHNYVSGKIISVSNIASALPTPTYLTNIIDGIRSIIPQAAIWPCLTQESLTWSRINELTEATSQAIYIAKNISKVNPCTIDAFLSLGFTTMVICRPMAEQKAITSSEIRQAIYDNNTAFIDAAPVCPYVHKKLAELVAERNG